jgi:general secretion pathway protein L
VARLCGIDVGERVVRVALVRSAYRRPVIEALVEVPIEAEGEAAAIKSAVAGLKPDGVAISLSGDRCFFRRLELPTTAQREIDSVLAFELESTVPFEMEASVFDHRMLKRPSSAAPLIVFAALAKIEDVQGRIDVAKDAAGREPDVIDPVPLANFVTLVGELGSSVGASEKAPRNALDDDGDRPTPLPASPTAPIALLDLGQTKSELLLLSSGEPAFARTLSRGLQGLPQPEAAKALVNELGRTFGAWRAQGGEPVKRLYLAGLGATAQGAEAYLSAHLGVPVSPMPLPAFDGVTPDQSAKLPLFTKAIGIALSLEPRAKGLNLRQGALAAARSYAFLREKVPLLSGLAAVILVSFAFSVVAELRALKGEREMLDAQMKIVTKDAFGEETTDLAHAKELLEPTPAASGKAGADDEDPFPTVDGFDVMTAYSKAVPVDITHDVIEFDLQRNHVQITATIPKDADASLTTSKIMTALKAESPCFKDIKVPKTTAVGEKQRYTLEFDIRCDEKKPAGKKPDAEGTASPKGSAP